MSQYIALGLNIAMAVFIGFGIIFGLIRGLRKTASRGIFLVITSVILLFITIPITSAILKIKVNTDITYMENHISGRVSILEIIQFYVENLLGKDFSTQNPEFVNVITAIPVVFTNSVVYLMLFIICKYALLPLNYLFYRLIFAPKKPKDELGFSEFNSGDGNYTPLDNDSSNNFNPQSSDINENTDNKGVTTNELGLRVIEESRSTTPDKVDNYSEILSNVQEGGNTQTNNETSDHSSDSNYAPTIENTPENTFGKDGTFIKTEIDEPTIERVTPADIEKDSKKNKKEEKRARRKDPKYKKHRLLGGLIGALCGVFIMSNILIPVYGFMEILKDANTLTIDNVTNGEQKDLSTTTNGVTDDILKGYDLSILSRVSKYSGVEGLALAEFDFLTTQKINNKKITLRDDINNIVITVQKTDSLMGKYKSYTKDDGITGLTQEELDTLITDTKAVLAQAESVKLIDCVADYLVPVICSALVTSEIKISDNEIVNRLAIDAIKTLATSKGINAFEELQNLLDLTDYLNSQKLLIRLIQNDFSEPIAMLKDMDEDFGLVLTNKLYKLKTVDLTLPYVVNIGLNILEQAINYGYSENNATAEEIKSGLTNFIDYAFRTARSLDDKSSIYITNNSLIPLGKLLQTAKTSKLLNEETYKNLVSYGVTKVQDLLKGLAPADLEDYVILELANNIKIVDNWEYEMETINKAVLKLRDIDSGILGDVEKDKILRQGTNINFVVKQDVFENLGEALDLLEGTCLFGASTHKTLDGTDYPVSGTISLFTSLINFGKTSINDLNNSSLSKLNPVLDEMKANLIKTKHTYDLHEATFWSNELKNIAPIAIDIYDMLENNDTGNFAITSELGKSLDKAKNSTVMLAGTTSLSLINTAMDIVEDNVLGNDFVYNDGTDTSKPQTLNDKIYKLFTSLHENLNSESIKEQVLKTKDFWEKELGYYNSLQRIAENASTIKTINDAKTLAPDLDIIRDSATIPSDEIFEIVAYVIRDLKSDSTENIDIEINNLLEKIATRLDENNFGDYNDFWVIELDYMTRLMKIEFDGDNVLSSLNTIGSTLDIVLNGYEIADDPETEVDESKNIRASYLITESDIRTLLNTAVLDMSDKITNNFDTDIQTYVTNAISKIADNIGNINIAPVSFERELTLIKKLSDINIPTDMLSNPVRETTDTDETYASKLEASRLGLINLGKELDSIAYHTEVSTTDGLIYTNTYSKTTGNSKFVTREILSKLVSDVLNLAKIDNVTNTKDESYNNLILDIQNEISDISNKNKTMKWAREFDFVNKLKELNAGSNYTIDNVATTLGKNLDAIAFNKNADSTKYNDIEYTLDSTSNRYLCTYIPETNGNSLLITRESLIKVMQGFMSDTMKTIKDDTTLTSAEKLDNEQNKIINEIIKNSYSKVAYNNTMLVSIDGNNNYIYYANFEDSLTELKNIGGDNGTINSLMDTASGNIKDMTADTARNVDTLLNNLENKPLVYTQLTRRIAKLILNKLGTPPVELADAKATYDSLLENYETRLNDSNFENKFEFYLGTTKTLDYTIYANPFATLQSKLSV